MTRRRQPLLVAVLLLLALALAPLTASAADQTTTATDQPTSTSDSTPSTATSTDPTAVVILDPTTITAVGLEQRTFDSPYSVDVVTREDINQRLYRTLPQGLRDVPGVMVQETAIGHGSPYIRGFTSFRNLFMIDGIRLNNSVFRPGPNQYWNTVDAQMIRQMEIVKGPSSVLYGSDAIGGTVNALTIDPYTYGQGVNAGGRVYYRGATATESNIVRGEASASVDDRWGFVAGGTFRDYGDLHIGAGEQLNTGYSEWSSDFKAEHYLNDNVRLVIAHQIARQNNVPRTHTTVFAVPFEGTTVGSDLQRDLDQERQLVYVQLHAEQLSGVIRELHISLSWQRQAEVRDRIRSNLNREYQGFDVNTLGFFIRAVSETPIGELTYGIDYYRDWVASFSSTNTIQGPVADDATYDLLGAFVQDRIALTPSFDVIIGVRLTYAAADAGSVDINNVAGSIDEDWFNASANLRFAWFVDPQRHWNVFGGVSQGFRAPNLSDLTRDSDFGGGVVKPAPNLDPETYVMFELGAKAEYELLTMQVSAFHYIIADQILRVPTGGGVVFNKINSEDGFMQGVEFGLALRLTSEWTLFGNGSWIDGENQSVTPASVFFDDYPSRLPPVMGQVGLRFEPHDAGFWVEALVRGATDADKLSQRDISDTQRIPPNGTPGYVVGSLRAGVELNNNFSLTASVENITDENYRIHGSGQNMPGRNFIFAIEGRF